MSQTLGSLLACFVVLPTPLALENSHHAIQQRLQLLPETHASKIVVCGPRDAQQSLKSYINTHEILTGHVMAPPPPPLQT